MNEVELEIYKRYQKIKHDRGRIDEFCRNEGISIKRLSIIRNHIENGERRKLKTCVNFGRAKCLWEYKYRARFELIPKNRKPENAAMLGKLIREMYDDGILTPAIAEFIGKNHSTVLHHLKKWT